MPRSGGDVGIAHADRRRRGLDVARRGVGALALAETRRGPPQRPAALGEPVRRTGKQERAQRFVVDVHPEAALVEMVRHQQLGGLVDRGDRPPRRLPGDGDLVAGPFEQPRIEDAVEDLLGLGPHERVRHARTRP